MILKCLFIIRDERSGPELILAWDEHDVSEMQEEFDEACWKAVDELQGDFEHKGMIDVCVNDDALAMALRPPSILGKVVENNDVES